MTSTNKYVRKSVYNSVLYFINDSVCKSVNAPSIDSVWSSVEQKLRDYDFRTKD